MKINFGTLGKTCQPKHMRALNNFECLAPRALLLVALVLFCDGER